MQYLCFLGGIYDYEYEYEYDIMGYGHMGHEKRIGKVQQDVYNMVSYDGLIAIQYLDGVINIYLKLLMGDRLLCTCNVKL